MIETATNTTAEKEKKLVSCHLDKMFPHFGVRSITGMAIDGVCGEPHGMNPTLPTPHTYCNWSFYESGCSKYLIMGKNK